MEHVTESERKVIDILTQYGVTPDPRGAPIHAVDQAMRWATADTLKFVDDLMAEPERLYPALLQFAQTVAKVSSMQYYKREVIQNLFYEQLAEFVEERLAEYEPRRNTLPIPEHDEYEVDYQFDIGPRPLFLFGVKDNDKARLATISCLEFQRRRIPFKGVMVHQDFESGITKKDRTRITSASDKQFPSLDDFRENGPQFFERERAA